MLAEADSVEPVADREDGTDQFAREKAEFSDPNRSEDAKFFPFPPD